MKRARAFTLVEILIVVVLLGVLAAIVIPAFGDGAMSARQSALSQELRILQRVILVYKSQHREVPPGYPNGQRSASPTEQAFQDQIMLSSNNRGQTAAIGTSGYSRGPYLPKIPANSINGKNTVEMLSNGEPFPEEADDSHGWIYKAATGELRPDCVGTDTNDEPYYEY